MASPILRPHAKKQHFMRPKTIVSFLALHCGKSSPSSPAFGPLGPQFALSNRAIQDYYICIAKEKKVSILRDCRASVDWEAL
jgi:hypothetical protein